MDLLYPAPPPPPRPTIVYRTSSTESGNLFTVMPSYRRFPPSAGVWIPSTLDFQVGVVDANTGQMLPNAMITLSLQAKDNTGGHWHLDPARPAGAFVPAGGSTGASGWLDVTYTAPEASALIAVTANCMVGGISCPPDDKVAEIRYHGLGLVDVGEFIGYTDSHPGSHYGSADLAFRLDSVNARYASSFGANLQVNDISLEWGGVFDLNRDWAHPHRSHRWGDNADLRLVPVSRRAALRRFIRDAGFDLLEETSPAHWHLTVD